VSVFGTPDASTRPRRWRRAVATGLATLALGALAACAPLTAGAAALVGDHRLAEADVQQEVAALVEERGDPDTATADLRRAAVQRWVYGEILLAAAADEGVTVTEDEIRSQRQALVAQVGPEGFQQAVLASGVPTEQADELLRLLIAQDQLAVALVPSDSGAEATLSPSQQQALATTLAAKAKELDISVNPRYGTFDVDRGTVVPHVSGGLAVDAASAAQ